MNSRELKLRLIQEAKELELYVIKMRRHIHMYPETVFEEENTAKFIEEELQQIGYKTQRTAGTGVITTLSNNSSNTTVALRADIDALNIQEENEVPYKSRNKGKMHACGHDAHTAMLLGAAKILFKYKEHLRGSVKLIFQPAEEGGGGAKKIIEDGQLENINAVFGIHVWQGLPSGLIGTRKGAVLASSDRFTIEITGKGGHVATPHQTVDPTSVLIDIYNALQKVISREVNPFDPRILALPKLGGSDAHNIIPSKAILQGTLRTLNPQVRKYIIKRIQEIVKGFSKAWRCNGIVKFDPMGYPILINDEETVDEVTKIIRELDDVKIMDQSMIGEDFAFYLQKTKGVFFTLGIYNEDKGITFPHHHPRFQVDEAVLWKGTALYALLGFFSSFKEYELK
jgi:amidohydrolase